MVETLVKGCFLGGSYVFINDTDYMLGAGTLMEHLIQVRVADVKKL